MAGNTECKEGNVVCVRSTDCCLDERDEVERKLADQGDHECQVLGLGPVVKETHRAWMKCDKNPKHTSFIPAAHFHKGLLPEGFKTDLHLNYVKYMSKRTVRLRVLYTSEERPDGYTFAEFRGFRVPHTGSGWVNDVSYVNLPCICAECVSKAEAKIGYYQIRVHTAQHVVYNTEEALETVIDLFYEEGNTADGEEPTMLTFRGKEATDVNPRRDLCTILCASHNEQLVRELSTFKAEKEEMLRMLHENAALNTPARSNRSVADACIIISHPHGKPKKITVGSLVRDAHNAGVSKMFDFYETDTCRGSSGAPVIVWRVGEANPDPYAIPAPHSEGRKGGLNNSGGRPFYFG